MTDKKPRGRPRIHPIVIVEKKPRGRPRIKPLNPITYAHRGRPIGTFKEQNRQIEISDELPKWYLDRLDSTRILINKTPETHKLCSGCGGIMSHNQFGNINFKTCQSCRKHRREKYYSRIGLDILNILNAE